MHCARRAWATDQHAFAISLWRSAFDLTLKFVQDDPRRAASLDTLATCENDPTYLQDALQAWDRSQAWVCVMDTLQGARSSSFHLRLESGQPGAYAKIVRQRHRKTLAAGRAGTLARCAGLARDRAAMVEAVHARRDAFGHREYEAATMADWLGEPIREQRVDRFAACAPRHRDDESRLYGAALLAPVLLQEPGGCHVRHP